MQPRCENIFMQANGKLERMKIESSSMAVIYEISFPLLEMLHVTAVTLYEPGETSIIEK